MAENEKAGREPIQVVQIDQDFCNLTYGVAPCRGGLSNLVNNSSDFSDADNWQQNPGMDYTYGQTDPDGGTNAVLADVVDGTSYFPQLFSEQNVPQGIEGNVWYSLYAKQTVGGNIDRINFQARGNSDAGGTTIGVSLYFGTADRIRFNGGDVVAEKVEDLPDGWVRWQFAIPREKILTPGFYRMLFFDDPSLAATGDSVLLYGFMITDKVDQRYVETTGEPVNKIGDRPCFNTRSTCQDPANYDKGVLPLKFVTKASPGLTDGYYLPMLQRPPKVTPAKLNPGGANNNARALGTRAQLSVQFLDAPHNDRDVDPYRDERDYDPLERGTFWTKWRARNPYYMQRPIKLLSGYLVDGEMVDTISREFVITGFRGPDSSGNVVIEGKDVLTLAEDEKAQAPIASKGKLSADITAGATSATLTPSGIGDSEYPASGQVRIGKEVCAFTRSGDSLTLTRGQFGTDAVAHDADDTVQLCLRYVSEDPQDILYDLLLNYANVPAAYLDKTQWDAEALDFLPRKYTAIITEPTGVSKLIGEMCQQMYFTIWWDERTSKVVLKAVRLAQEDEVSELDDSRHLIGDSIKWEDLADELITQVWVYYGQIDPTDKLDQGSNYSTIAITADPSAEGEDKHNLRRIKTIFSRWIDATNASAAEDLGSRILNRYGNAPRQVTFRVDAKDDYLWLGNYIRLTNRLRVDQFGRAVPVNLQIFEAAESSLGSEYQFTAQEFIPALIGGDQVEDPTTRTIPITSDLLNVNLRTLHDSLFGAPTGNETITFVVREGVTIGGDTAGGGVNVPYDQRVTVNDFYAAGNSVRSGQDIGSLQILQRNSISSSRTFNAGDSYEGGAAADWVITEYPVSVGLQTGTWPSGQTINLVIEAGARVLGEAGNGSAHGLQSGTNAVQNLIAGGDGGDALQIDFPISITNGGLIAGGGGGGAGSAYSFNDGGDYSFGLVSGAGGAGYRLSAVKQLTYGSNIDDTFSDLDQPTVGDQLNPGNEGRLRRDSIQFFGFGTTIRLVSGDGAGLAQAATDGGQAYISGDVSLSLPDYTDGGQAGKAIAAGANLIEWVNKGDVRGDEVA